jgi:hypothetical protein
MKYAICITLNYYKLEKSSGIGVVMRESYSISHEEYYIGPFEEEEADKYAERYRQVAKEKNMFSPLPKIGKIFVTKITPEISQNLISPDVEK